MKVAVCCIIKFENLYVRDFVEYYIAKGFDNIIICDNNNKEYPQIVLQDYIDQGIVLYENYRNMESPQLRAYDEVYEKYKVQFDWIAFFDCDEFIELVQDNNIKDYLSRECFKDTISIQLNWRCYGDNDKLFYENTPVWERFPNPIEPVDFVIQEFINDIPLNCFHKSIIRCNPLFSIKFDIDNKQIKCPHIPDIVQCFRGMHFSSANGQTLDKIYLFIMPDYSTAYIKHYNTLTITEFMCRRYGRKTTGDGNCVENMFEQFYENKITKEKADIANYFFQKFGIDKEIKAIE